MRQFCKKRWRNAKNTHFYGLFLRNNPRLHILRKIFMIIFRRWDTKIPPSMRPAQICAPSEYAPPKISFEKYAPMGALSAVYGILQHDFFEKNEGPGESKKYHRVCFHVIIIPSKFHHDTIILRRVISNFPFFPPPPPPPPPDDPLLEMLVAAKNSDQKVILSACRY